MAAWTDGYFSDATYTKGFYRQITPAWLTLSAVLCGHRPPPIHGKFRWCELGCGQGLTALGSAACHAQAEFYAFDFNPSHIDNARALAAEAGIDNVLYEEISFAALAAAPDAYPKMDFIVLHGVWSWVSTTQRAHLLAFIRDRLAPGGLVYISYNALAGWAALLPIQRLLRLLGEIEPGPADAVIGRGLGLVRDMVAGEAEYFRRNPFAAGHLVELARQDARYLPHELLHESWEPSSFDAVARDLAEAKCGFIGSATLCENLDEFSVPASMLSALAAPQDARLKEVLRDFGAARSLRRDIYRRGTDRPLTGAWLALLDAITLTDAGHEDKGELKILTCGDHGLTLNHEVYGPVREGLRAGPLNIGDLRHVFSDTRQLREIISVLAATGIAHPTPCPDPSATQVARVRNLNRVIARQNAQGGALNFQFSPKFGAAVTAGPIEIMMVSAWAECPPASTAETITRLAAHFTQTGQVLSRDGAPVQEPNELQAGWREILENFAASRRQVFVAAGIMAAGIMPTVTDPQRP